MELTSANVIMVGLECFPKDDESREGCKVIHGLTVEIPFVPERLEKRRADILDMLHQLPDNFQKGKGDGWSFLNAALTKEGVHWGEHNQMELLFCLGMAIDAVEIMLPRELWKMLPGGMPYMAVVL